MKRYLWLQAMWACLEKGKVTTGPSTTAHGAVMACGLEQSNIRKIPTDIMKHAFTFLDIMDYVCNVLLVCKEWNVKTIDLFLSETPASISQLILIREIMYNSLKCNLAHPCSAYYFSKHDLLYDMETSISFALLYTAPFERGSNENNVFLFERYPAQPLYFVANKDTRRFSYIYLLHYIYLYRFGERDDENMCRMYTLLTRFVFTGSVLGIGFMTQLFYDKYGAPSCNEEFWDYVQVMLHQLYVHHANHVQHKPICVADEIVCCSTKILATYARRWKHEQRWMRWTVYDPNNLLSDTLKKAIKMFCE
eukprot:412424_1